MSRALEAMKDEQRDLHILEIAEVARRAENPIDHPDAAWRVNLTALLVQYFNLLDAGRSGRPLTMEAEVILADQIRITEEQIRAAIRWPQRTPLSFYKLLDNEL